MRWISTVAFVAALSTQAKMDSKVGAPTPKVKATPQPKAGPTTVDWALLQTMDSKTGRAPGNLQSLNKKKVRVPGFMVPLDFSEKREVKEFLLTPAYPGCMHVPPPAPNQTVHVKMAKGKKVPMSWGPIWIEGTLTLINKPKSGYGEASFELTGETSSAYTEMSSDDHIPGSVLPLPDGLPKGMPPKPTPPVF